MQFKKGEIFETEITAFAFQGNGIGEYQGMKVFIPKTFTGDKVRAKLVKIKKTYAHGELIEILEKSPDRMAEMCSHADICGGCQMQFIPYEKQLEFKRQHVIDSMQRIGKLYDVKVAPVIPSQDIKFYRNKMEFSFGYDAEMDFKIGLHVPGRRFDIFDVKDCILGNKKAGEILELFRTWAKKHELLPFKYSCGEGFLRSLFVRDAKRTGEIMLNLMTSDEVPENFEEAMEDLVKHLKGLDFEINSFYWTKVVSKRGQKRQDFETLIFGSPTISEHLEIDDVNLEFDIYPSSFFQVNTFQAEILYKEIFKRARSIKARNAFDLFCGTGTISLFLATFLSQVIGVEINEASIKAAKDNAKKNGIDNIDFIAGDAYKVIADLNVRPDLIVVDPPRAGLGEKTCEKIIEFSPDNVIYVSCDPTTLARDLRIFADNGYEIGEITPVDMFPHTYHIENVVLLSRK